MPDPIPEKELIEYIRHLRQVRRWGEVKLTLQDGYVVKVEDHKSMKAGELLPD